MRQFVVVLAALLSLSTSPVRSQGVPVSATKAARRDVSLIVRGIGTVQALQSVLVRARVDGTIDRLNFNEGQDVKTGDLIATIDPRPYQAALDQAVAKKAADMAMLANSKRDLARYSDLAKNDFASRQSVDTQLANVLQGTAATQADDAAIAAAKLNLDFTRITSPVDGRVGLRLVDAGNLVHASDSTGIVVINQIHPISALFTLPQDELPVIQDAMRATPGQPLTVFAYSGDNKRLLAEGNLVTVDNTIDTTTGTIKLKSQFNNTEDRLWPGEFINCHLQYGIARDAVTVPTPAVQHGVNGLYVYAVQAGDVAKIVTVETGQVDGATTIITKGLTGGELVITEGQSRLTDGTKVAVVGTGTQAAADLGSSNRGG